MEFCLYCTGTVEEVPTRLTANTPMSLIVREMQKPDSGLEIRDRNWLKITIPNAFIGWFPVPPLTFY
jgi:hypothetical protein